MARAAFLVALWLAALAGPAVAQTVHADDYDAFFLWAGVAPQPLLGKARSLYILQGQVDARPDGDGVRLMAQGAPVTPVRHGDVWLVYRAHTLRWTPRIYAKIRARLDRWRAAGDPVAGVQIDFDARTRHLGEYADFLRDVRTHLPADDRLSITGLLDWGAARDPADLNALGGVVDDMVIQTYQGRGTIAHYDAYLDRLDRLSFPFRIGLIQDGQWRAPASLAANPMFRGYVVFLRNPGPRRAAVVQVASTTGRPLP